MMEYDFNPSTQETGFKASLVYIVRSWPASTTPDPVSKINKNKRCLLEVEGVKGQIKSEKKQCGLD